MKETTWFRRGDGHFFHVERGSAAEKNLRAQGLEEVDGPDGAPVEDEPEANGNDGDDGTPTGLPPMREGEGDRAYLLRLKKAQLLEVAAQRGLTLTGTLTVDQIIDAILAFKPGEQD